MKHVTRKDSKGARCSAESRRQSKDAERPLLVLSAAKVTGGLQAEIMLGAHVDLGG